MRKRLSLILLSLGMLQFSRAQISRQLFDTIDQYMIQMVKSWDVPGMSIGIIKDGEIVFTGNYGQKQIGEGNAPDQETLYAIASNTKAFTSALMGMLVQEGTINWDDKVQQYLPYFAVYDPWVSAEITIRDLLCHRVGLGTFSGDVIWYKSDFTSEELIKRIKHLPQAYDFRAGYGYSNLMYITAGKLIEEVTGKSWAENIQEKILRPLNMQRTLTSVRGLTHTQNYATPHARENEINAPIDWENWDQVAATGGLISSVNDMAKWMIFNLNHGIIGSDTLLTSATRNILWTPHNNFTVDHTQENDFDRHFSAYGLGWGISDYRGNLRVGHTGGYDGMITAVNLIPDQNLGVVVLTNGMQSPIMAATYYALDMMLQGNSADWSNKLLEQRGQSMQERIEARKAARIEQTEPSAAQESYAGSYRSEIYGDITVERTQNEWVLKFSHSPSLSARLSHWHYDVWKLNWEEKHAWFDFGTVRFDTNSDMQVTGLTFNVPNNDIFFEELKPYKVKK